MNAPAHRPAPSQGPARDPAAGLPMDVRLMRTGANLLIALLVLAGLGAAGAWLLRSPWFSLRQIHVEGEVEHNTADSIRRHAAPHLHGSYLTMNLAEARAAFESVPWVRRAEVRRIWPHDLVVRLEEHRAAALWEREDADSLLVNTFGEVFEVNVGDVDDDSLPKLRGPQGSSQQVLEMWRRLSPEFTGMRARVERLALSDRGSWSAQLDSGAILELGRGEPDQIVARTQRFVRSVGRVAARFQHPAIEYADLRHSDGYALRLAGMGTTSTPPPPPRKAPPPARGQ